MTPDLRALRYFVAAAEEANFTRAAKRLYVAQQTLSAAVRDLERQLGVQLFIRSSQRVELTAAGEALLGHARTLLASAEDAVRDVQSQARGQRGHLRFGVFAGGFADLTPQLVRAFEIAHPEVALTVQAYELPRLPEVAATAEVDIAGVWGPLEDPDLAFLPLREDSAGAFLPLDHPLATRASVRKADLAGETFLLIPGCFFSTATAHNAALPTPNERTQPVESGNTALQLIAAGRGVGLGALSAAESFARAGVAFVPIEDSTPTPLGLAWRRERSNPLIDAFTEVARSLPEQPDPVRLPARLLALGGHQALDPVLVTPGP